MSKQKRVFYLSDRTGITAETLGHSLLTQFDGVEWKPSAVSDCERKATDVAAWINRAAGMTAGGRWYSARTATGNSGGIKQANCRI